MTPSTSSTTTQIAASDLTGLLERALAHRFGAGDAEAGHYLAGFAVTGADATATLAATLAAVAAVGIDHDAGVVRCDVSGVMATDEGQRAWGFVTLDPAAPAPADASATVTVERVESGWRATVTVAAAGASD